MHVQAWREKKESADWSESESPCSKRNRQVQITGYLQSSEKSWMTWIMFFSWIQDFDTRITNSKKLVLLFIDNAEVHNIPDVCLNSTQIVFIPKYHELLMATRCRSYQGFQAE